MVEERTRYSGWSSGLLKLWISLKSYRFVEDRVSPRLNDDNGDIVYGYENSGDNSTCGIGDGNLLSLW